MLPNFIIVHEGKPRSEEHRKFDPPPIKNFSFSSDF